MPGSNEGMWWLFEFVLARWTFCGGVTRKCVKGGVSRTCKSSIYIAYFCFLRWPHPGDILYNMCVLLSASSLDDIVKMSLLYHYIVTCHCLRTFLSHTERTRLQIQCCTTGGLLTTTCCCRQQHDSIICSRLFVDPPFDAHPAAVLVRCSISTLQLVIYNLKGDKNSKRNMVCDYCFHTHLVHEDG